MPDARVPASASLGEELRQALALTLPDYMLPHAVEIIAMLPLTRVGKVDRQLLVSRGSELAVRRSPKGRPRGPVSA